MRLVVSDDARALIRERGRKVYVWRDDVGGRFYSIRCATEPPRGDVPFARYDGGGFEINLDATVARPPVLQLRLRRWPRRRVIARGWPLGDYVGDGMSIGGGCDDGWQADWSRGTGGDGGGDGGSGGDGS